MESSSASSRVESFPIGLRVLVVDDDLTWLKILEKMLRKCSYDGNLSRACLLRYFPKFFFSSFLPFSLFGGLIYFFRQIRSLGVHFKLMKNWCLL